MSAAAPEPNDQDDVLARKITVEQILAMSTRSNNERSNVISLEAFRERRVRLPSDPDFAEVVARSRAEVLALCEELARVEDVKRTSARRTADPTDATHGKTIEVKIKEVTKFFDFQVMRGVPEPEHWTRKDFVDYIQELEKATKRAYVGSGLLSATTAPAPANDAPAPQPSHAVLARRRKVAAAGMAADPSDQSHERVPVEAAAQDQSGAQYETVRAYSPQTLLSITNALRWFDSGRLDYKYYDTARLWMRRRTPATQRAEGEFVSLDPVVPPGFYPHKAGDGRGRRRALTVEELRRLLGGLASEAKLGKKLYGRARKKQLLQIQTLVVFAVIYFFGLRVVEVEGIGKGHFFALLDDAPEFGDWAILHVVGKFQKRRLAATFDPMITLLLDQWWQVYRPELFRLCGLDPEAVDFLFCNTRAYSPQGKQRPRSERRRAHHPRARMAATIENDFLDALRRFGIRKDPRGSGRQLYPGSPPEVTTHSLRHSWECACVALGIPAPARWAAAGWVGPESEAAYQTSLKDLERPPDDWYFQLVGNYARRTVGTARLIPALRPSIQKVLSASAEESAAIDAIDDEQG